MIISQQSKERILKKINSFIAKSPDSKSIDLPELSCLLKMRYNKLILLLEILIRDGSISIHSDDKPHKNKFGHKEIERQIKLLNDAFVWFDKYYDTLILNDEQTIKISINSIFNPR